MSKSKKKHKNSNDQKRSNKFNAHKLQMNQSRSAFKEQQNLQEKIDEAKLNEQKEEEKAVPVVADEVIVEQPTTQQPEPTQEVEASKPEQTEQPKEEQQNKNKQDKEKDNQKKKDQKAKKPKRKFGQRTKETVAELKRVTWPTFGQTVKKTGLVIAVVLFFGVALFAIERLLAWLYTLLTSGIIN